MSLDDAVGFIREQVKVEPLVGIVLGSGLGGLADELEDRTEIPYSEIPDWPVSTAIGHSSPITSICKVRPRSSVRTTSRSGRASRT